MVSYKETDRGQGQFLVVNFSKLADRKGACGAGCYSLVWGQLTLPQFLVDLCYCITINSMVEFYLRKVCKDGFVSYNL